MSNDRYTETTHQSWGSRIGASFKGIVTGLILFALAFPLLFWNEGRSVERYKTLEEGAGAVITAAADKVDPQNNGKLVHVTGLATTTETLRDPQFAVSLNAIKLRREVEMYQWREQSESHTEKKLGGGTETVTEYSYDKTWSAQPIDSGKFRQPTGHENPATMPYPSREQSAQSVTIGAYKLPPSLVARINNWSAVDVPATLPAGLRGRARPIEGGYYIGKSPSAPGIGDLRITFTAARPTQVSLMARQLGNGFEPYRAKAGGTIEMLVIGNYSSDTMIAQEQEANTVLTWILRVVGFVVMAIGLGLVLKPLSVLGDVVPIIGNVIGAGTGMVSFLIAGALSLVTIAIAWLFYRPLLAVALIVAAVGLLFGLKTLKNKKTSTVSGA